jgi:DNA polymerase-3 subunit alpha
MTLFATSEFSLGHSLLSVKDIVEISKEYSLERVVVTDTMSVSSMIPLAEKLGDRLVTGVRISLVDLPEQVRQPIYQPKIYPKDEFGMELLYKYLSKSFERPYFYEQARLDLDTFSRCLREGHSNFYVSTGDINSLFKHPKSTEILENISSIIGANNLIVDICPVSSALFDRLNYSGLNWVSRTYSPINLFIPALYKKEDADVFPIHFSINKNVEFNYLKPSHQEFYYEPNKERKFFGEMLTRLKDRYGYVPTSKFTLAKFEHKYEWKAQEPRLPKLSATPMETLRKLSIEGFKDRLFKPVYGFQPERSEVVTNYADRLKQELKVLDDLGFSDYFLLVYELIDWCKKQEIKIGPGRGSVGGSLVAFCLGITDVDPLRFGLMFERFINPTRIDLPDIDMDFMSTRRHEIVGHLNDRYGADNVAGIINYSSLQSKSALRSTCRILGLPDNEYTCSKLIPSNFGFSTPLKESAEKVIEVGNFAKAHPDTWAKALKLEGKLRNFSTHAAGIIVSNRPLTKDAVIEVRSENRIINWDKKICEKQGLVKLDVLGLTTLDIIDLSLAYIKDRHKRTIVLEDIALDDKSVLQAFASGNTGGVFQFEGGSVRKLLKELSREYDLTFDDLVAANALNRPGPIEAGLVQMYVDGKNGALHDVDHSSMADILKPTYNVMVYQEQIMKVAVEFAGYTLPESDNLRKIMGKKLPEEMKKEAGKFIDGAVKTHPGLDPKIAEHIFDQISKFAFYAFNKSHSVEYSLLSYICMWLKVYYPVEYYAASLTYVDDKKVRNIINEAKKSGLSVDPPSINYSTDKFVPVASDRIVSPLSKIKYVAAGAAHIMHEREVNGPFLSIHDLQERTISRLVTSRVIKAMLAVGALDEIKPLPSLSVDPVERSKALNEYLPSIPLGHVCIKRKMAPAHADKKQLTELIEKLVDEDDNFVKPFMGNNSQFMVVFDSATATEAKNGMFTSSRGFNSIQMALYRSDLDKVDGYWTGLVKRQKEKKEKIFSNVVLENSFEILKQEIAILRPTVILCLGSHIGRMFDPSLKGGAMDNAGKIIYNKEIDCNILFGFNPSMLFFNPDLEPVLTELFETVRIML